MSNVDDFVFATSAGQSVQNGPLPKVEGEEARDSRGFQVIAPSVIAAGDALAKNLKHAIDERLVDVPKTLEELKQPKIPDEVWYTLKKADEIAEAETGALFGRAGTNEISLLKESINDSFNEVANLLLDITIRIEALEKRIEEYNKRGGHRI